MSGSQVTVLCPNGRRVIVKTTPGMSILQVIENSCQKQKLNPDLYSIKILRRTLDPSSTIRFSNIPNNAQLELITLASPRQAEPVNISLATESGERLLSKFSSSATFMDVLKYHQEKGCLELPSANSGQIPVVVYTMERLSGERLHSTILKSVGIVKGSYMLRYLVQEAANKASLPLVGSGSLARPKVARVEEDPSASNAIPDSSTDRPRCMAAPQALDFPPPLPHQETPPISSNPDLVNSANRTTVPDVLRADRIQASPDVLKSTSDVPPAVEDEIGPGLDLVESHHPISRLLHREIEPAEEQPMEVEGGALALQPEPQQETIIPLGIHEALLFSLDDAPPTVAEEHGDDFFDLSVDEVRRLHCEQMRRLRDMEDVPLTTERLRSMEQDAKLLSAMKLHPATHIRVIFPDRLVIQATFKPHDTVANVQEFLRQYLRKPTQEFYLYTIFPREVLDPDLTLVKANCIPNARLYFGRSDDQDALDDCNGQKESSCLSQETLRKKSSYVAAQKAIKKARFYHEDRETHEPEISARKTTKENEPPIRQVSHEPTRRNKVQNDPKLPKWFKMAK